MKGLLVHVGDDINPGFFKSDGSYVIHLLPDHDDPDLDHMTYGDWTHKTHAFADLVTGDYVFFNFKFNDGNWYITSYFLLKEVLDGFKVLQVQDKAPYKFNAHVERGDLENWDACGDFRMLVGSPKHSLPHLLRPIRMDVSFWKSIGLCDKYGTPFTKQRTTRKCSVARINGSFLRMPKPLSESQVKTVLRGVA